MGRAAKTSHCTPTNAKPARYYDLSLTAEYTSVVRNLRPRWCDEDISQKKLSPRPRKAPREYSNSLLWISLRESTPGILLRILCEDTREYLAILVNETLPILWKKEYSRALYHCPKYVAETEQYLQQHLRHSPSISGIRRSSCIAVRFSPLLVTYLIFYFAAGILFFYSQSIVRIFFLYLFTMGRIRVSLCFRHSSLIQSFAIYLSTKMQLQWVTPGNGDGVFQESRSKYHSVSAMQTQTADAGRISAAVDNTHYQPSRMKTVRERERQLHLLYRIYLAIKLRRAKDCGAARTPIQSFLASHHFHSRRPNICIYILYIYIYHTYAYVCVLCGHCAFKVNTT